MNVAASGYSPSDNIVGQLTINYSLSGKQIQQHLSGGQPEKSFCLPYRCFYLPLAVGQPPMSSLASAIFPQGVCTLREDENKGWAPLCAPAYMPPGAWAHVTRVLNILVLRFASVPMWKSSAAHRVSAHLVYAGVHNWAHPKFMMGGLDYALQNTLLWDMYILDRNWAHT